MDNRFEWKIFIISAVLLVVLCVSNGVWIPLVIEDHATMYFLSFILGMIYGAIAVLFYTWAVNTQGEMYI